MAQALDSREVNTSAYQFEELATSLASLSGYMQGEGKMDRVLNDFTLLYRDASQDSPSYSGINELTGQSLSAVDRRAGHGAWLLTNIERLQVYGVHSLLWHKTKGRYSAPLIDQMARALGVQAQLSDEDLQRFGQGQESWVIDVLGLHQGDIWLVQTLTGGKVLDSATTRGPDGGQTLFPSPPRVFDDPVLAGDSLATLHSAWNLMRQAFPTVPARAFCLVSTLSVPDFEFYRVDLGDDCPSEVVLRANAIRASSVQRDFRQRIVDDIESLWTLPGRLNDDMFRGLPPCRGGRTLSMLALMAKRQRESDKLLLWTEGEFRRRLRDDLNYDVPRDKVRHDLVDRLAAQGFMRKWENLYHLSMKGMARYLYCLAKYTTLAPDDPMDVLDECVKQRARIIEHCKCL